MARRSAADQQRLAADPTISAWVSANAGTGKTHVLVQRVLRLLLSGAPAESILCLTFTKAAAAEMSNRLIRELSRWPAKPDAALRGELAKVLDREPVTEELNFARCLFAKVLDAPGGLKIMTIHAFCDRVLRRFPLEAGAPPSFTVLTDAEQRARAWRGDQCGSSRGGEVTGKHPGQGADHRRRLCGRGSISRSAGRFDEAREKSRPLVRHGGGRCVPRHRAGDPAALGVRRADSFDGVLAKQAALGPDALIARSLAVLREERQEPTIRLADKSERGMDRSRFPREGVGRSVFLTKKGAPRPIPAL